jgi:hypothetical protein
VERQQQKIERLQEQVAERDQKMADAEKQIADSEKQIADAEKQIADLERQLAARQKNSTNSSKPPSSDGFAGKSRQRGRRKKSERKPGGQKGHPGHHRPLTPPEKVREVRPVGGVRGHPVQRPLQRLFQISPGAVATVLGAFELKRNILGIQDFAKTTDAQRFCRDALALYARLFRLWRKFQGSLIDRNQLILRSIPLQQRWLALAEQYLDSDDKEVRNMATALFQHCGRLFTFIEQPGVEPTNNCVEQALRIAVQLRKIIFGNRSAQGEVATARLLTTTQTCRMQGHNTLGYLTEAIICYRRNQPAPSLLPQRR